VSGGDDRDRAARPLAAQQAERVFYTWSAQKAAVPLEIVSGTGARFQTADGARWFDLGSMTWNANLGHGHPRMRRALAAAAERGLLAYPTSVFPDKVRAGQLLVDVSPPGMAKSFICLSGAEANENALKIALRATGRAHVAAIEGAFHGRTAAAGAVTFGAREKWYGFPRTPFDVSFIPRGAAAADIAAHVTERTAAVIVEPVQGLAGAVDLGAPFLSALRQRCDALGACLIFDEVQSGMGRTGEPFAANLHGVTPDLLTTAKALGNGFPCAALLLSAPLAAALRPESLGTTFGGGPLACAAIEAVIEALESERLLEQVRRIGAYIRARCVVGPVTAHQGAGLLVGLRTRRPAKEVQAELLECGILAGTASDAHVVRLLPPYILQEEHVDMLRDALAELPP
jgi:acetylornithine/succinyldiaminopimelate/putrescine aminotransferase